MIELKPGLKINDKYVLLELVGEGGMSVVFKAADLSEKKEVAIKFLKVARISSYLEERIRLKKEVEIISKFIHPSILKIFAFGETEGIPYIVMEFSQDKSLYDLLTDGKVFGIKESVMLVRQISEALSYVHSKGIIHKDLKPGNILVNKDNAAIKLLDFGLASVIELTQINNEEEISGTFGYMSPEAAGIINKPISEKSDLYSLGIIFYRLLTQELPFKGNKISEILHQQAAVVPIKPSKLNPDIAPCLDKILLKMLEKEPELRY